LQPEIALAAAHAICFIKRTKNSCNKVRPP
jgi:hypothetical protein